MKPATTIPATPKPRKPRVKKSPTETSPAPETLLHIDLWASDPSAPLLPLAAQMVSDLIRTTAGDLQSSTGTAVAASYRSTRQAIAAARNLCPLIEGFSTTVHAAFTLGYPGDLEHRTSPTDPQRILLIGTICDAARTIPGLRFRELPATASGAALELLTPTRPAVPAAPAPVAIATPNPLEVPPQTPAKLPVRASSTLPQQSQPAPNPKRRIQIFAAAGAVALTALIAFFITRPSAKSQPAPTPAPTSVAAAVPPAPIPQPPIAATPKPIAEPRKQAPPPPKVKQPPPEREAAPAPSTSGVTFSPDEIKRMIARADKLSGDGNYAGAIAVYDAVLRADHHNVPATEGRQRAIYNRDHR